MHPLRHEHLTLLLHWLQQSHIKQWYDSGVVWSYEKIVQKYTSRINGVDANTNKPIFCFIISDDEKPIGYVQYYNIADFENEFSDDIKNMLPKPCASFDIFIGEREYCGKGIGATALKVLFENYIFENFNAICISVDIQNKAALKAYQKAGLFILKTTETDIILWKKW
ncbi:MAG TPA: GNAT family N-acetyltransferase [Patescibacteria group bacterium]|nr:GNAT family N-acetyltransferase [Patescibacteria group bacterium]